MNIRIVYASTISLLALLVSFYAVMTLAFFFGEQRSEWAFPVLITAMALVLITTSVQLWRARPAVWLSVISLASVALLIGWIALPPVTFEPGFIALVLAGLIALALLVSLTHRGVRSDLS